MSFRTTTLGVIAGCLLMPVSAVAADFKHIKTESEYLEAIAGKKMLAGSNGWFKATADGNMTGRYNGAKFVGAWVWKGKYFCRNGVFAGQDPLGTDCQKLEFDGTQLRVTRNKGKGNSVVYTLK